MKEFNNTTVQSYYQQRSATIGVYVNGSFVFNKETIERIELRIKDSVVFLQDNEDWFITKKDGGFILNENKCSRTNRPYLKFTSAALRNAILENTSIIRGAVLKVLSEPIIKPGYDSPLFKINISGK